LPSFYKTPENRTFLSYQSEIAEKQRNRECVSLSIMQNKPNFQKSQMNANLYNTTDYENKSNWTLGENKPNSNPIKPNLKRAKMNITSFITKDYRKKDDFDVRINKPNLVRRRRIAKMDVNLYITKDYEEKRGYGL